MKYICGKKKKKRSHKEKQNYKQHKFWELYLCNTVKKNINLDLSLSYRNQDMLRLMAEEKVI